MARRKRNDPANPSANGAPEFILSPGAFREVSAWLDRLEQHCNSAIRSTEVMRCEVLNKWADNQLIHWQKVLAVLSWQRQRLKIKK